MPRARSLATPSLGDPDRKRVLNVLAQRRYRQRKREKYAVLEEQANSGTASSASSATTSSSPAVPQQDEQEVISSDTTTMGVDRTMCQFPFYEDFTNPLTMLAHSTSGSSDSTQFDYQNPAFGFDFEGGMSSDNFEGLQDISQSLVSVNPDITMEIPLLKLMNAGTAFVRALKCEHLIWDPTSRWTVSTAVIAGLPSNMQPTLAQLTVPHHPVLDILPWPQLRSKLICMFALPEAQRPHVARDDNAIMNLVYDMEDEREGFRINGEGLDANDWEVGLAFFKNWWWALDHSIVAASNGWRQRRGENRLTITAS